MLRRARNQLAHYEPLDWETHRAVVAALVGLVRHQQAPHVTQGARRGARPSVQRRHERG